MYAKIYWVSCKSGKGEALLAYYDEEIAPAIQSSAYHIGHHMVEVGTDKWLLVSNYTSKTAADAAVTMVRKLVNPMTEKYGMELGVITEGEVVRTV